MEQSKLKQARQDLIQVLKARFPGLVSPEVIQTINSQPMLRLLDDWVTQAAKARTIDDFVSYLRR